MFLLNQFPMTPNSILASLLFLSLAAAGQDLPHIVCPDFNKDTVNISRIGARADGITLNNELINNAIASLSSKGGGTVVIPRGFWLSGPITLRSNVNLHLREGAVLQFSDNPDHYTLIETNWEGVEAIRAQSPISGADLENVAITGSGIIDGAGQAWRPVKKSKLTDVEWKELVRSGGVVNEKQDTWYPSTRALAGSMATKAGIVAAGWNLEKAQAIKEFLRPNMVSLIGCKKVLIEGVTFQNSPAWCIHPLLCQHLTFKNVTVRNPWNAQNGDGLDIESCRYVLVEGSSFDVGDDAICIKSGRDEEGRKRGVPTEDVIVRNCTVFHGHGGFVVGSEMSGGARNLFVYDCNFIGTDIGLRFKTTRGRGGVVENIQIRNVRMSNIGGAAILFDMYYMAKDPLAMFAGTDMPSIEFQPVTEGTPQLKSIHIQNVVCKGAETAVFVRGLPEMNISNIVVEDISMQTKKGVVCIEGTSIQIRNATLITQDNTVINVQDSKDLVIDNLKYKPGAVLANLAGERTKNISLINTDTKKSSTEVVLGKNVSKTSWIKK
jgi:DNA sulfur modification protein DndE